MKKKILPISVIGILILSGFGAVALTNTKENIEIEKIITISNPIIIEKNDYISVNIKEAASFEMIPGEPVVPKVTEVFTLPFKSTIKDVSVKFSEAEKLVLSKDIIPAQEPIIDGKLASKNEINQRESI